MTDNKFLLAFDPGKSSGIVLGAYTDTEPYVPCRVWQPQNGVQGLLDWHDESEGGIGYLGRPDVTCISEKFIPRPGGGFGQSLDSTIPLVGEGVLIALGYMGPYDPKDKRWSVPQNQYRFGGKDKAEKRKLARAFLKKNGLYAAPKEVGCKDSEDVMSATLHSLYYMTTVLKHKPTWEAYYSEI